MIWAARKADYFWSEGWTGQITLELFGKLLFGSMTDRHKQTFIQIEPNGKKSKLIRPIFCWVLMRELRNLSGEAVKATQSFVDIDDVAAIPDTFDGRRIPVGLRLDGSVVAINPACVVFKLETILSLFRDRDCF